MEKASVKRALELIDLKVSTLKNKKGLKELLRAKEAFVDLFGYGNDYNFTTDAWHIYFFAFNYTAIETKKIWIYL